MTDTIKAYDAGSVDIDSSGVMVLLEMEIRQLLIYPTVDASVTLNDGDTKSIFLPAGMWTPISISRDYLSTNFVIT